MSDQYGWWQAADLQWYPPELHPEYRPPYPATPPPTSGGFTAAKGVAMIVIAVIVLIVGALVIVGVVAGNADNDSTDVTALNACKIERETLMAAFKAISVNGSGVDGLGDYVRLPFRYFSAPSAAGAERTLTDEVGEEDCASFTAP